MLAQAGGDYSIIIENPPKIYIPIKEIKSKKIYKVQSSSFPYLVVFHRFSYEWGYETHRFKNPTFSSLRRLGKVASDLINSQKATIKLSPLIMWEIDYEEQH